MCFEGRYKWEWWDCAGGRADRGMCVRAGMSAGLSVSSSAQGGEYGFT